LRNLKIRFIHKEFPTPEIQICWKIFLTAHKEERKKERRKEGRKEERERKKERKKERKVNIKKEKFPLKIN
jgi:hypothetical protein